MVQISVRTIKLDEKLTFYHFERIFRLPWNIFNRVWNDVVCDAGLPAKPNSIKPSTPKPSVRVAKPARRLPADREHKAEVPSIRR